MIRCQGRASSRHGATTTDESANRALARDRRRWSPAAAGGSAARWAARSRPRGRAWCWSRATPGRWRRRSRRSAPRGGEAHAVVADVADKDAAAAIAGQAAALVGPIDLLINNASTLGPVPLRLLLDTDCEDLERALAVNLVGPFRLTKAIAGSMVLRGAGTIVNVSSDAAIEAYERWGAYGASKAALDQLGRVWAAELAGTGVRVFTVDPGEMDTRMHADAIPDADRAELSDPARVAARIVALVAGSRHRRAARASRSASGPRRRERRRGGDAMRPARTYPERRDDVRLLVIDPAAPGAGLRETRTPALPELLAPGDLLVVNDAATLPASLRGTDEAGRPVEVRLIAARGGWRADGGARRRARLSFALRGRAVRRRRLAHAHRRPPAPAGARARARASASARSRATVGRHATLSPRLVELRFDGDGDRSTPTRSGPRSTRKGARSSTPTSRTIFRSGRCRPSTRRAPGRSRCRRPGGRCPGRSCSRCAAAASAGRRSPTPPA